MLLPTALDGAPALGVHRESETDRGCERLPRRQGAYRVTAGYSKFSRSCSPGRCLEGRRITITATPGGSSAWPFASTSPEVPASVAGAAGPAYAPGPRPPAGAPPVAWPAMDERSLDRREMLGRRQGTARLLVEPKNGTLEETEDDTAPFAGPHPPGTEHICRPSPTHRRRAVASTDYHPVRTGIWLPACPIRIHCRRSHLRLTAVLPMCLHTGWGSDVARP